MLALLATFLLAIPAQLVLGAHSRLFIDGDSNVRRWSCDSRGPCAAAIHTWKTSRDLEDSG
jgi:hypothetical protein